MKYIVLANLTMVKKKEDKIVLTDIEDIFLGIAEAKSAYQAKLKGQDIASDIFDYDPYSLDISTFELEYYPLKHLKK